jgi:hypothetical protein
MSAHTNTFTESATGQILFGGIDTAKYQGTLSSLKIYPNARTQNVTSFNVAFTSLSATSPSGTDQLTPANFAVAAILDSGTSLTYLPASITQMVFKELGATTDRNLGVVVPCALANVQGTLDFGFGGAGGPVIKVPVNELVLPLTDQRGNPITFTNGQQACSLGIDSAGNGPVLFGDTFLRSAYVVYDLNNNRIGIAQTNFNATTSNIVAFPSLGAAIPSATTASGGAQVTQTASGIPRVTATTNVGTLTSLNAATGAADTLSAASGFGAAVTASAGKKNVAGRGPEPFAWEAVVMLGASMGLMLVGGGVLAWL